MDVAEARSIYRDVRDRALRARPDLAGYINRLWLTWDADLARFGDATALPDWMDWYRDTIKGAPEDTVVDWLDAFPDSVHDQLWLLAGAVR